MRGEENCIPPLLRLQGWGQPGYRLSAYVAPRQGVHRGETDDVAKVLIALLVALLPSVAAQADPLPSRDPHVVVPLLRAWHEHDGYDQLTHILGKPDMDIGSGIFIWVFRLKDGTSVYANAAQRDRMISISRSAPGGLAQKLYQPIAHDLDRPQPASAPF